MMPRREYGSTAWPFVALIGIALLFGWLFSRTDPAPALPVVAAPAPVEVTRIVVATATPTFTPAPTQTPYVVYQAATNTPTPAVLLCAAANDGDTCVQLPPTATNTPLPPLCREITVVTWANQVCVKGDGATSAKEVVS